MQIQEEKNIFYRPKWELKAKGQPHPMRRWCHTAIVYMNDLFIFGGRFPDSAKLKELVFKINCQTFLAEQIHFSEGLSFRESHSCSLIKDSMYVLFGVDKQKVKVYLIHLKNRVNNFFHYILVIQVLNDCLQFKITPNSLLWEKKQQKPQIEGRQSHLSATLGEKYILIYGGVNQQEQLLTDFYIYNIQDFSWRKVKKIKGNLEVKVGGSLTIINNQIYIFGGQINDQNQYSNQIYKIKIVNLEQRQNAETQIQIFKLLITGVKPLPRTCHAATAYKQKYIIILGGQTHPKPPSDQSTLLNDVWIFDVQKNQWEELKIQNSHIFKPRSNFTATVYKDNLIIFGGLISIKDYRSSDEMLFLLLNTGENKLTCNICKTTFKQIQKSNKQFRKQSEICSQNRFLTGISNVFKVSSSIKHPFECFGLIIYSLELLQVQSCKIFLDQNLIFKIQNFVLDNDQWNHIRSIYQFSPLFLSDDIRLNNALKGQIRRNRINFFAYNLKNICLRLGNSFLLSWTNGQDIKIVLINNFGIFQTINPSGQKSNAASHSSIILQYVKQQKINLLDLFENHFSIYISSLKKLKGINQINYNKKACDINSYDEKGLKQYLQIYFEFDLKLELSLNQKEFKLNPIKIPKTVIQHQETSFFQRICWFQWKQSSFIRIFQNHRLLHYKKSDFKVCYDFQLNKAIQTNITFTEIDPSYEMIQQIKKIIIKNQQTIKKRHQPTKGFQNFDCMLKTRNQKLKKNGIQIHQIKIGCNTQIIEMDLQKNTKNHQE